LAVRVANEVKAGRMTIAAGIEKLYLMTLARRPTAYEAGRVKKRYLVKNDSLFMSDFQWALINRVDFLYNY
jgi:hypothetical protein